MKFIIPRFLAFALLLFTLQAHATGTNYSATISITNTVGTANGQYLTFYFSGSTNGVVYNWTNINPVGLHQLAATNTAAKSATNLYTKLARDYTNAAGLSYGSSTSVVFQIVNNPLNIILSTNWGSVVITTNVLTPNALISAAEVIATTAITINGDRRTGWPAGGGGSGIASINGLTGSNQLITLGTNSSVPVITAAGTNTQLLFPFVGTNTSGFISSNTFNALSSGTNATGSDTWIQYNSSNHFASAANLTYVNSGSSGTFSLGTTTNLSTHTLKFQTGITTPNTAGGTIDWSNAGTSVIKEQGVVADSAASSGYLSFLIRGSDGMLERLRIGTNLISIRGTAGMSNLVVSNTITGSNMVFNGLLTGTAFTNLVQAIVKGIAITTNSDGTLLLDFVPNSALTTKGDILARSATAIGAFPAGPDGTSPIYDSSQTFGIRAGNITATATNAIGNSGAPGGSSTGTNTSFIGNVTTVAPIRVYSSTNSYAAIDLRDTNGFGVSINVYNSTNTNAAPVWGVVSDALTNGTLRITSGGSNVVAFDRPTYTTTFGGPITFGGENRTNWPTGYTNANVLHVSKNGNDSTGTPFLTIAAASIAASKGTLVHVHPGLYTERDWLKNGVNYHFDAGATNRAGGTNNTGLINDFTGPTTNIITGQGYFCDDSTWNFDYALNPGRSASGPRMAAMWITDPLSMVSIRADTVTLTNCPYPSGSIIISNAARVDIDVKYIPCGVYWARGLTYINSLELGPMNTNGFFPDTAPFYGLYLHCDTTNAEELHVKCNTISSRADPGGTAIFSVNDVPSENYRSWIEFHDLYANSVGVTGIGRMYVGPFQKIKAAVSGGGLAIVAPTGDGQRLYLTGQKVTAAGAGWIGVGDCDAQVLEWEDIGIGVGTEGCGISRGDGTLNIYGGTMTLTNAAFVDIFDESVITGHLNFHGTTLISTSTNNPAFHLDFDGVSFDGGSLTVDSSQWSFNTDAPQTVNIINAFTVNGDPSGANTTFSGGGSLIVNGTNTPVSLIDANYGSKYFKSGATNFWSKDNRSGTSGWIPK